MRKDTFLYCRLQKWVEGGGHQGTLTQKKKLILRKRLEDVVKQKEKDVLDLLESIMRPTDPVKEELRQKLIKMTQFVSKIKKMRVCTFQMSGKIPDSTNLAFEDPFLQYLAPLGAKYMEKRPKNIKNAGYSP